MDLKEAEDIKKRWQEYTEELYKKDFHDQAHSRLETPGARPGPGRGKQGGKGPAQENPAQRIKPCLRCGSEVFNDCSSLPSS